MQTSEARALVTEIQDRLIDLYVQQDEALRSDWHGRGVGQLLMARLIEVAQQSGISALVGLVLNENKPMLKMCRKLGFSIAPEPNDATVLGFENRWLPCTRVRLLCEAKNHHDAVIAMRRQRTFR